MFGGDLSALGVLGEVERNTCELTKSNSRRVVLGCRSEVSWPREHHFAWESLESLLMEDDTKSELELAGRVCRALNKCLLGE